MQRRPSSQATSTLSNTPNLYIGSYTGNPMLVPRPVHQTENSTLVLLPGQATLVVRTLFFDLHKQDSASRKHQQTLCFAPASLLLVLFASTLTEEYHLSCVDSDCLACVCQAFDLCSSAISGTFWICRTVSASLINSCTRSYCNVRLLAEDQVRRFHFYNPTKTAGIFAIIKPSRATISL